MSLELTDEAVPLTGIEVVGRNRCRSRPELGEATARVWEEARKGFRIAAWTAGSSGLVYTTRRRFRRISLPGHSVLLDSVQKLTGLAARPYRTLSPEDLAERGYVRRDADGSFVYYAPDETVLGSDTFLEGHCLVLAASAHGRASEIGLAFRPVRARSIPDIEGVMWLDSATAELRSVDFSYVNVGARLPMKEAGGHVEYARLPSGALAVVGWRLAFPEFSVDRPGSLNVLARQPVIVATALDETSGEVTAAVDGTGRSQLIARAQSGAGNGSARLVITVTDATTGARLAGVGILVAGTASPVLTDSVGVARVGGVPPGLRKITGSALGFEDGSISVDFEQNTIVQADLRLRARPVSLQPLAVTGEARDPALVRSGFYERERRGGATFIAGARLEAVARRSNLFTAALMEVPGIWVGQNRTGTGLILYSSRGSILNECYPRVFVDGFDIHYLDPEKPRMDRDHADINRLISLAEIAAIEVYGGEPMPVELEKSPCGLVLVWTKHGRSESQQ